MGSVAVGNEALRYSESAFQGQIGVARRDITPPVGIRDRLWGAVVNDVYEGIHRPLTVTALALLQRDLRERVVLICLDLGGWQTTDEEWALRGAVLDATGLSEASLMVCCSHTHAAPSLSLEGIDVPGGDLVAGYANSVRTAAVDVAKQALDTAVPGILTFANGSCSLAQDRDLDLGDTYACGFNPKGSPDSTVVVGRATDLSGRPLATVVNYACHPTTLAWQNHLVSPDYVGAMRETVEQATDDVPCLFMQGASGDLGPRLQYTDDVRVADANGRQLGLSVLAALAGMLNPGRTLDFAGVVESGTKLAVWEQVERSVPQEIAASKILVSVPLKDIEEWRAVEEAWKELPSNVRAERARRRTYLRREIERDPKIPVWVWIIGDAVLVAFPHEAYSQIQQRLRAAFEERVVVFANLTNGAGIGYLPVRGAYASPDIYQSWQTPYAPGALEILEDAIVAKLESVLSAPPSE